MVKKSDVLKLLPIEQLQRGPFQPRRFFDPQTLEELAQSIKQQGIIEPLVVRKTTSNTYEIIAGERRWRAAMNIGLQEIPCIIRHVTNEQAAAIALIENIQRQDLNVIEEANGYHRLMNEFHFFQDEIAILVGKSRSHIANLLRLLTLNQDVQTFLCLKQLTPGHGRLLVGLTESIQTMFALKTVKNGWSVRRLEQEVRSYKITASKPKPSTTTQDTDYLATTLSEQLGAPVQVVQNKDTAGGWITITFYDNDTLSGLLERLGIGYDY